MEALSDELPNDLMPSESLFLSGLWRLKGEVLHAKKESELNVENCYQESIDIAKQLKSKWEELLTKKSLAKPWKSQGKDKKAYELLAGIFNWFSEGFDTNDMQEAKALLEKWKLEL